MPKRTNKDAFKIWVEKAYPPMTTLALEAMWEAFAAGMKHGYKLCEHDETTAAVFQ